MDDSLDPEVTADLELRDRTRRERAPASVRIYDWTPTPDVEHWPCRGGCGRMVGVPQEALDAMAVFNTELAKRGEQPINKAKTVFCATCKESGLKHGADVNRRHVTALAVHIRRLVELADEPATQANAQEERELLEKCRLMHHPDIDGLTQALRDRRERNGNAKSGKRRL